MFHKHNWVKIKETYYPGGDFKSGSIEGYGVGKVLIEMADASRDRTTLLWECSKCQKIRKEEMLGKSQP